MERTKKVIAATMWLGAIIIACSWIIIWSDAKDAELMKINYCWDSSGQHYVAPDARCTN